MGLTGQNIGGVYYGGWNCDKCGAFIPYGQPHVCPYNTYTYTYYGTYGDNTRLIHIEELLEKIIALLEKK